MYDVAIIGAGPSGSTLARLLGEHLRVLLVDRRRLGAESAPHALSKPCGGLLAPAAQTELARQGLGVPGDVTSGPQLFAVRAIDRDSGMERLYPRSYVNVDRERFDRWLLSLVDDRVERAYGWSMHAIEQAADGVFLRFNTPGGGKAGALARFVVGADGGASCVRRLCFPHVSTAAGYVAVQAMFESCAEDPHFGAFFDSRLTDHYGWTIPKGDRTLVGAAFPRTAGVPRRFEMFLEAVRLSGQQLGTELARSAALVSRPTRPSQLHLGCGHVALVGEAAGLISPSSAEGISYAMRSSAALAEAFRPGTDEVLERYRSTAAPLVFEVCAKMVKARTIGSPWVRSALMRMGVGSLSPDAPAGYGSTWAELLVP